MGAAILVPNSLALLNHAYPDDKERGRAVGIWAAGASLALTAGPLAGGGLIALVGWRSIFLVNLPIGLAGLWLTWRYAEETTRAPAHRLDLPGQAAAIGALGLLAGALIEGGVIGWSNPWVLAGFAAAVVLGVLFVVQERRAPQPMLPLSLFANRLFSLTALVGLLVNVAFYGLIFVLSLYFQEVNGLSPLATGLAFLPMMGVVLPVNLLAPRAAERFGAPAVIAAGAVIAAAGCAALLGITQGTPLLGDRPAARRDRRRPRPAGAAAHLDAARQRGQIPLGHRGRRAQRDAADRQRARRRAVRLAARRRRRIHDRRADRADHLDRAAARWRRVRSRWRGAAADRSCGRSRQSP